MFNLKQLTAEELIVEARTWPSGKPYPPEFIEELALRLEEFVDRCGDEADEDW